MRSASENLKNALNSYYAAFGEREFRRSPGVQPRVNERQEQGNDNASERAAEPTVNEYRPAAPISFKKGMSEPGAENASGHARKNTALKQERAHTSRRTLAEKSDHHRGRDDADGHQNARHGTQDQTERNPDADENQRHDKKH